MDPEVRQDQSIYPPQDVLDRLFVNNELPPKIQRLMTRSWTKLKSGQ